MITTPPWYGWLESQLEPSRELMIVIAFIIIMVTLILIWNGNNVALAGWLVYLLLP